MRPGAKLPAPDGDERATIFACRNVLWEITITMKSLYLWEFYKCSQKQFSYVGRREAHRWGYALSAFSHSTPCPLGRSETRAKSGPNRALSEPQGGEFSESQVTNLDCDSHLNCQGMGDSLVRLSPQPMGSDAICRQVVSELS